MAEAKGLMKPVKLKNELAEFLGATELPRTEITKKLWDYVKANKLQTKQASSLWLMRVCSRSSKTQNPKANQARSPTLQI
jgi:chromatin remodeling complex protein RSC6